MKKLILSVMLALGAAMGAHAAGGDTIHWDKAPSRTNDLPALQNGAKLFVNYCLNCHSAAYMRFNRLQDIGISEQQIKDNLLTVSDRVGDVMKAPMDPKQAKEWFGGVPPDLTLIARSRSGPGGTGADYLYTYMRTFYRDAEKPTGWNNLAFPNVGMPHVLWQLQGERQPVFEKVGEAGHETQVLRGWKQVSPGAMTPLQYDEAVGDLVGYLQWMAEPAQNQRVRIGVWVLLFLGVLTVIVWRLNAAFWKNVK
ncbi:cytochrome c1 [Ramlibacter sp.]|uniref:cytochrome c1 n=1 Tax=Ramlibacter sp. TaxID=1917967 RepID=UPI002FC9F159